MGSRNKSGWLANRMLHRFKSHSNSFGDPASAKKPRAFACSLALNSQKFDSAQDDRMTG
jgi:hypothetical protein